ncbi:MAG: hypothetical protein ABI647_10110 [Gemmatimonadota bacterium]
MPPFALEGPGSEEGGVVAYVRDLLGEPPPQGLGVSDDSITFVAQMLCLLWIWLGLAAAVIGSAKGRTGPAFYLIGAVLGPVAIAWALAARPGFVLSRRDPRRGTINGR